MLFSHFSEGAKAFPQELVGMVSKCYRAHLREQRIQLLDNKLVCYITSGGNNRLIMLMIVPKSLRRMIFDSYHASRIGGHLGINKTLTVICLRFFWPEMQKDIILWVRSCASCIQAQNTTYSSKQLVHLWPLLTPFAIISADLWSPGDIVSSTGVNNLYPQQLSNMQTLPS